MARSLGLGRRLSREEGWAWTAESGVQSRFLGHFWMWERLDI